MKIFKVWVDHYDYDQYDSFVAVAESAEAIKEKFYINEYGKRCYDEDIKFGKYQGEIHIEEIDLNKEGVILSSFNAG